MMTTSICSFQMSDKSGMKGVKSVNCSTGHECHSDIKTLPKSSMENTIKTLQVNMTLDGLYPPIQFMLVSLQLCAPTGCDGNAK